MRTFIIEDTMLHREAYNLVNSNLFQNKDWEIEDFGYDSFMLYKDVNKPILFCTYDESWKVRDYNVTKTMQFRYGDSYINISIEGSGTYEGHNDLDVDTENLKYTIVFSDNLMFKPSNGQKLDWLDKNKEDVVCFLKSRAGNKYSFSYLAEDSLAGLNRIIIDDRYKEISTRNRPERS